LESIVFKFFSNLCILYIHYPLLIVLISHIHQLKSSNECVNLLDAEFHLFVSTWPIYHKGDQRDPLLINCNVSYYLPDIIVLFLNTDQIDIFISTNVKHVFPVELFGVTIIKDFKIQNNAITTFLHEFGHWSEVKHLTNISRSEVYVKRLVTVE